MSHWRLHLGSAWLRSVFDLWLWGHVMKEIYIGAELCEDQRYLGPSVTTNHHLRWSDILERAVQPLSTRTIFRMRLNMENVDKATKTSNGLRWSKTHGRPSVCVARPDMPIHTLFQHVTKYTTLTALNAPLWSKPGDLIDPIRVFYRCHYDYTSRFQVHVVKLSGLQRVKVR